MLQRLCSWVIPATEPKQVACCRSFPSEPVGTWHSFERVLGFCSSSDCSLIPRRMTDTTELVQRFGWADYLVFIGMLVISAIIGVYYAW